MEQAMKDLLRPIVYELVEEFLEKRKIPNLDVPEVTAEGIWSRQRLELDRQAIASIVASRASSMALAKQFGISQSSVSKIKRGMHPLNARYGIGVTSGQKRI